MIIKLENQDDIKKAAQLVSLLNRPMVNKVIVSLPWLDEDQRAQSEKTLKFLFNDCGCLWGGLVFLITFSIISFSRMHGSGFSWAAVGISFLIGAGAAIIAKFIGLAWSYQRLKTHLQRIRFSEYTKNKNIRG